MLVSQLVGKHPEQGMLKSMVVGIKVDPAEGSDAGQELVTAFRFILDPKTFGWQRG